MDQEIVFSVSEFNEVVNNHLRLLEEVVVEGEISQLRVSQGKWIYLTIKDEGASVEVFGMTFRISNINSLEEGMLVKITGYPGIYQKTGRFSLNADQIIPSGEGALKQAYEKLKNRLDSEGLFSIERKRSLPMFPQNVGLLTAKNSQAYLDFVKVTNERIGGVKLNFYPVNVQGQLAVSSVIGGIKYFNSLNNKMDLLIITRGGGSLEDLIAFNDEKMVRAVFASKIPTVCAIGHEGDVSLVELVADLRASTPSNASELIFRHRNEVIAEIDRYVNIIEEKLMGKILSIEKGTQVKLISLERYLDKSFAKINQLITSFAQQVSDFDKRVKSIDENISILRLGMVKIVQTWIKFLQEKINHIEEKLIALNPTRVLQRGFSIIKNKSGQIVRSVTQININDNLVSIVADGSIESIVNQKTKGEL